MWIIVHLICGLIRHVLHFKPASPLSRSATYSLKCNLLVSCIFSVSVTYFTCKHVSFLHDTKVFGDGVGWEGDWYVYMIMRGYCLSLDSWEECFIAHIWQNIWSASKASSAFQFPWACCRPTSMRVLKQKSLLKQIRRDLASRKQVMSW